MNIISESPRQTELVGRLLGSLARPGDVFALFGELGSGKTLLSAAISEGARIDDPRSVHSPTFTLANQYSGPLTVFHCDLYRLSSLEEAIDAGLEEMVGGPALTLVEWADRIPSLLPDARLEIFLQTSLSDPEHRKLLLNPKGSRYIELEKEFEKLYNNSFDG